MWKNEEEFLHTQRENDIQLRVNTSGYATAQVQGTAKRTKYGTEFILIFFVESQSPGSYTAAAAETNRV